MYLTFLAVVGIFNYLYFKLRPETSPLLALLSTLRGSNLSFTLRKADRVRSRAEALEPDHPTDLNSDGYLPHPSGCCPVCYNGSLF